MSGDARELERLVDEYAQADGLDRRRRERLARLIVETAQRTGLAREAGVESDTIPTRRCAGSMPGSAISRTSPSRTGCMSMAARPRQMTVDPAWQASAAAERAALLAALDGRRVAPGPAGAPARGRRDVLPTGRNLFTADPRMLPTQTAMELGRLAADEVIRTLPAGPRRDAARARHRSLGQRDLRTGGEEIAQGLALMGCRPIWDHATGRVTGIEVLPPAAIGRPRVDVTWRISGLFRDLFPAQIALIDAAVRRSPRARRTTRRIRWRPRRVSPTTMAPALARIFGTAPGAYGAGIEELLGRETRPRHARRRLSRRRVARLWRRRRRGHGAARRASPSASPAPIFWCIGSDDPGRDLLEGAEDAAFVGGFAAAAASLGRDADLIMLDITDPQAAARAHRSMRRWPGSCAAARSIRASSPA